MVDKNKQEFLVNTNQALINSEFEHHWDGFDEEGPYSIIMNRIAIGYGRAFPMHTKNLEARNTITLAVVDSDREKRKQASEEGYVVFNSISSALESARIEGITYFVDICTPNNEHLPVLKEVLDINPEANIIVEKPIVDAAQIPELEILLESFPDAKISVNENYASSKVTSKIKEMLSKYNLTPTRIVSEQTKNRGKDFLSGRYIDTSLFCLGYEGPHQLTSILGLGSEFLPDKIVEAYLKDAVFDGERFENQGVAHVEYIAKNGVPVSFHTSMDGTVHNHFKPYNVNGVSLGDPTRYRVMAVECEGGLSVVGFYPNIKGFEGNLDGSVVVMDKGKIVEKHEPIYDNTMLNQLGGVVSYFKGLNDNPGKPKDAIEIVKTLDRIIDYARR